MSGSALMFVECYSKLGKWKVWYEFESVYMQLKYACFEKRDSLLHNTTVCLLQFLRFFFFLCVL